MRREQQADIKKLEEMGRQLQLKVMKIIGRFGYGHGQFRRQSVSQFLSIDGRHLGNRTRGNVRLKHRISGENR